MIGDEQRTQAEGQEEARRRPPRLRLIRAFLSLLVGFMAGLVGWTFVFMAILLRQGPSIGAQATAFPLVLHIVAFGVPAVGAGLWFFRSLGSLR